MLPTKSASIDDEHYIFAQKTNNTGSYLVQEKQQILTFEEGQCVERPHSGSDNDIEQRQSVRSSQDTKKDTVNYVAVDKDESGELERVAKGENLPPYPPPV